MDIIGVPNVMGEVELLASLVEFFKLVGLTKDDVCLSSSPPFLFFSPSLVLISIYFSKVGIRISNRKLLQTLLEIMGITGDQFTSTCIVIDKFDKLPKAEIYEELSKLTIAPANIERLMTFLAERDFEKIGEMVGRESKGVQELVELFGICKSYGFGEWIEFDPKVVRYTERWIGKEKSVISYFNFINTGDWRIIQG
jgi:histidyl-tRNA synthetase